MARNNGRSTRCAFVVCPVRWHVANLERKGRVTLVKDDSQVEDGDDDGKA